MLPGWQQYDAFFKQDEILKKKFKVSQFKVYY